MAVARTIVATGASSGLGLETIKLLLQSPQPYRVVLGARNTSSAEGTLKGCDFTSANTIDVLPLDLADLKGTKSFAEATLQKLGDGKIDYLFLSAAISEEAVPSSRGYKWSEPVVVNHVAQFYLVHLLREKLEASKARIVIVSSGAFTGVKDPNTIDDAVKPGAGTPAVTVYSITKFIQLLSAHWLRRELSGVCDVVAVSPGFVPHTGLFRSGKVQLPANMPDARTVTEGAQSLVAAFMRSDFPADRDQIFLTSWGAWWEKSVLEKTLDRQLQDKWSFSKEEIEEAAGIST